MNYNSQNDTLDALQGKNEPNYQQNGKYFVERVGKHPDRIKNLYFVYAATLKAVSQMAPKLSQANFKSGVDEKAD